jgi:hypothetical protein
MLNQSNTAKKSTFAYIIRKPVLACSLLSFLGIFLIFFIVSYSLLKMIEYTRWVKKRRGISCEQLRTPSLDYYENLLLTWTNTSSSTLVEILVFSFVCEKRRYDGEYHRCPILYAPTEPRSASCCAQPCREASDSLSTALCPLPARLAMAVGTPHAHVGAMGLSE